MTELFNYLSDSDEESKEHSANYLFRMGSGSHPKHFEDASKSNDTGTFPIGQGSDEGQFARESRERSLLKTYGDEEGDYEGTQ